MQDRHYKVTGQPVRDASGNVTDIMVVAVDVIAQVLARRRIESLVGELKQADQRKDKFLATLAHQLRNPMAAISGQKRTVSSDRAAADAESGPHGR